MASSINLAALLSIVKGCLTGSQLIKLFNFLWPEKKIGTFLLWLLCKVNHKQKPYLSNQDDECQGQHQLKKNELYFTYQCHDTLNCFCLFLAVKTITRLIFGQSNKFQNRRNLEKLAVIIHHSHSQDNPEFGHLTLLFCREWHIHAIALLI